MSGKSNKTLPSIILLIILLGIGWVLLQDHLAARKEAEIRQRQSEFKREITSDIIKQYEITKRSGSEMDACVHAMAVAEVYLQTKDELNYKKWKSTAKVDCEKAGMPM